MPVDFASRFAVVIPVYNESATIRDIASRVCEYIDFVVIVDDGSTDNTVQQLEGLHVSIISNPSNVGKGESLRRGAQYAIEKGADYVLTLDGDGQHLPEDIPLLFAAITTYPNKIIIAARLRDRHQAPPMRRFANQFADFWISWAAGHPIRDSQSGFRLYPAAVFQQCMSNAAGFTFESEILINAAQLGIYTLSVAIDTIYHKQARASYYRPAADTLSIVRMVGWKLMCRGFYPAGLLRSLGLMKYE